MSQLRGGGWSKIVGVRSKKDGDNVDVYLMMQGDQIEGLAVISAEPKEIHGREHRRAGQPREAHQARRPVWRA